MTTLSKQDQQTLTFIVEQLTKLHATDPETAKEFAGNIPAKIEAQQLYYLAQQVASSMEEASSIKEETTQGASEATQDQQTLYSVALYEVERAYGGPEEGGWYYDSGWVVSPDLSIELGVVPKLFTASKEARDYRDSLSNQLKELNSCRHKYREPMYDIIVQRGYPQNFPKEKPYYE